MAKIPFDIKYRPQIESGEYKVETSCGLPARIICWDRLAKKNTDDDLNLCVLVPEDEGEAVYYYHSSGKKWVPYADYDLFIITPEEELTEFEKVVRDALEYDPDLPTEEEIVIDVKEYASELLALAREEFIKDGYVIEKKTFHDAVEKVDAKVKDEVSASIDLENFIAELGKRYSEVSFAKLTRIAKAAYNFGKAEALKDLPRWRVSNAIRSTLPTVMYGNNGMILYKDGLEVSISDLEKLPKEDESHE